MRKNIFISKNKKYLYFKIYLIFFLLIIYFISFQVITNKKYFIINENSNNIYYTIPNDKEGEQVKFTNKKSINNIIQKKELVDDNRLINLNYTIQIFSDPYYNNIDKFLNNELKNKFEIISSNDLYIFSISTQIGVDYFITYKNFETKTEAIEYCKKLSFVKKCLIINAQYL